MGQRSSRRKRQLGTDSIFETLSDLSLSTLGLSLICFVLYVLVANVPQLEAMAKAKAQIEAMEQEVSALTGQVEALSQETVELTQQLEAVETEKQALFERNQYTGLYTGSDTTKFMLSGCNGNRYRILDEEIHLTYLQDSGLVTLTTKTEKGTGTFRFKGSFSGHAFEGVDQDFSRSKGIEYCGVKRTGQNTIRIEFGADHLVFYQDGGTTGTRLERSSD